MLSFQDSTRLLPCSHTQHLHPTTVLIELHTLIHNLGVGGNRLEPDDTGPMLRGLQRDSTSVYSYVNHEEVAPCWTPSIARGSQRLKRVYHCDDEIAMLRAP